MNFKNNKKAVIFILVFLFLLNVFAWLTVYSIKRPAFLEVIFFDVGQGDAALT